MEYENCKHNRIKKNFPFGRKSKANKFCKDCGGIITNKMIKEMGMKKHQKRW